MRIGLCQLNIAWEDKVKNMEKVLYFLQQGRDKQVDIVFFPEMTLTGFSMQTGITKDVHYGDTIQMFQEVCKKNGIAAGFGWVEGLEDGKAKNHYAVVDEMGKLLVDYVKVHPFSYGGEALYFTGGDEVISFNYKEQKISIAICYDLRFPELFRIMDQDTTFVIVPANWPATRREHWKCLLQARAIENQIYVAGVNCVGAMNGGRYSGDSTLYNPMGEMLDSLTDEEGMLIDDITNDVMEFRNQFQVRQDQKIEIRKLYHDNN